MNWSVRSPEGLRCAVRALKKEILGFRFDYPLPIVPEGAAKDSLHYHLYSDSLAWEALRLDPDGIPQAWYRSTGAVYCAPDIAWYGVVPVAPYLPRGDQQHGRILRKQDTCP